MDNMEQLEKWIKGESVHDSDLDQCVPDFSCCHPEVDTPTSTKERFKQAFIEEDNLLVHEMLGMFLANMLTETGKMDKVNIAGLIPKDEIN